MSAFGWLFSPSSYGSRSSEVSAVSSNSNHGIDRVLHGRVSKPTHTKPTSKAPKQKAFARDIRNDEDDEEFFDGIKQEDDEDDDGDGNSEDESSIAFPKAMMAQQTDSEYSVTSQQPDPKGSHDDDTDSEPDPDTAWRLEQIFINIVLNSRNEFTLMPSTWKMHFRGIPLPDSLYYSKEKSKSRRPRIYAHTNRLEYRGALALRKLIDVHARIQDIRVEEAIVKNDEGRDEAEKRALIRTISAEIVKQLRRALEQALDWAKQDGQFGQYGDQLPPNVRVMELRGITMTDQPDSEVKIQTEMCRLAEQWRVCAANGDAPVQVPTLFGFVIMKHIITIVTLDASDPYAIIHVPCQLHMAEKNQHQWNALAILVTICWARDVLLDYINARPDLQPEVKSESSDPDA
ncbi:hypothetical protein F4801DRAFT_6215 [Xylaria longipes]|nr:hypothetical protein F4801DRAFT_6215 [Xylaria longipes]RYC61770.1 hypothetical protein CHU98_g4427 [Xylaria longipes]